MQIVNDQIGTLSIKPAWWSSPSSSGAMGWRAGDAHTHTLANYRKDKRMQPGTISSPFSLSIEKSQEKEKTKEKWTIGLEVR